MNFRQQNTTPSVPQCKTFLQASQRLISWDGGSMKLHFMKDPVIEMRVVDIGTFKTTNVLLLI